ncbi:MAG: HlyC/CorC family transporter [Gammaproteobacteria bacterium]
MQDTSHGLLLALLAGLILLSGFFSGSETGMMSLNRYRLKHLARQGHRGAQKAKALLDKPEQLIGVILIGNNFVNILASSLATVLALSWFGDNGIAIATMTLTIIILIFAEVTPKTLAAFKPERIAFLAAHILRPLLTLLYPLVWLVNVFSTQLLKMLGINLNNIEEGHLSRDELRTVVMESGNLIPRQHRRMLVSVLDLEHVTVEDIMVPRNEIHGLDIENDVDSILQQIRAGQHTRMPVFKNNLNHPMGVLHMRKLGQFLASSDAKTITNLLHYTDDPYYTLEGTPLHTQLNNFQKTKNRMALVVDEYGDIQGLVTVDDILEEIVGEFTTDYTSSSKDIHPLENEEGYFIIDGTTNIRDINKYLHWDLPTDGPKTLSGLIIGRLEFIPENNISLKVNDYIIEVLQTRDNVVKTAKLTRWNQRSAHTPHTEHKPNIAR